MRTLACFLGEESTGLVGHAKQVYCCDAYCRRVFWVCLIDASRLHVAMASANAPCRRGLLFLPQLNLSSNGLRDRAVVALLKGVEANNSLQVLDLSYNLWEDTGAAAMGRALVRCCHPPPNVSHRPAGVGFPCRCEEAVAAP